METKRGMSDRLGENISDSTKSTFKSLAVSLRTTRFNIQKFYMALALRLVLCMDIRTTSDLCHLHRKMIGFYNRGGRSLQCGTD